VELASFFKIVGRVRETASVNDIKQARRDFANAAEQAAAATVENLIARFSPGSRISKHAHWFVTSDDAVLIAVVAPEEKPTVADEVLAYGLAWQGNRDLHLVLPSHMIAGTVARLPWIETEVRVWVLEGAYPQPIRTMPRVEVFEHLRALPPRVSKRANLTTEQEAWLAGIDTSGLEPQDRSYRAWHHQGLQVLKVARTRTGLRIQAGVQYTNPVPGRDPFDRVFTQAPTTQDLATINACIAQAKADDGSLTSQMREHRMQATLASQWGDLGLVRLLREYPAYRGLDGSTSKRAGRPGYIDFLGVDAEGRFHVVETKIGHDPRVVLQALDYAIWVRANEAEIRARLRKEGIDLPDPKRTPEGDRLRMHLVLGPGTNGIAFNRYLAPQLEALKGDCAVQVNLVADLASSPLTLKQLAVRDLWEPGPMVAAPVMAPRWPGMLTRALIEDTE
jgi:hypothetical protein